MQWGKSFHEVAPKFQDIFSTAYFNQLAVEKISRQIQIQLQKDLDPIEFNR